jgi:hypothetical protein
MKSDGKKDHIDLHGVFRAVLSNLPERSQDIIAKRFGVTEKKPLTLQAIGDEYNITRERVRQIVQSGLKSMRDVEEHDDLEMVQNAITDFVQKHHGIVAENAIIDFFGGEEYSSRGSVRFFIEGLTDVEFVNVKKYPVEERVVMHVDFDVEKWFAVHNLVKELLEAQQKVHTIDHIHKHVASTHEDIDHDQLTKYLIVSREIGKNPFDKWGIVEWDDVSPRGVREKALLIMKEKDKPMHFREIAEAIDHYGLGKKGKKSHPQTVHNELIRDENFVLVGRGVYALNTESYIKGTVKDVIENVLNNSDEPLTAEEVVERVLKMRYVKPSTIKVNLNAVAKKLNKKYTLDTKRK